MKKELTLEQPSMSVVMQIEEEADDFRTTWIHEVSKVEINCMAQRTT